MGSIPVGESDFFFVPRSRHAEYYFIFYISLANLRFTIFLYLSLLGDWKCDERLYFVFAMLHQALIFFSIVLLNEQGVAACILPVAIYAMLQHAYRMQFFLVDTFQYS